MLVEADFWNFLPERYLPAILEKRRLHFQNVVEHSEVNVVKVDGRLFEADTIGYFSFTKDQDAPTNRYFWKHYGEDGYGSAIGFRNAGWKQDGGPIATGDLGVALSQAHRQPKNLYLEGKDINGSIRRCYYSMVFYATDVKLCADLRPPTDADLLWSQEICFTQKPEADSPDSEERLIILDCPTFVDFDYSAMRPYLYPRVLVLGYNMSSEKKAHYRATCPPAVQLFSSTLADNSIALEWVVR
jgi:hypothetical protein